jgi:hypothetical protein
MESVVDQLVAVKIGMVGAREDIGERWKCASRLRSHDTTLVKGSRFLFLGGTFWGSMR